MSIFSVLISIAAGVVIVIGVMLFFPLIGETILDRVRLGERVQEGPAPRNAAQVDARVDELVRNAERLLKNAQASQGQTAATQTEQETKTETAVQPTLTSAPDTSPPLVLDAQALEDIQRLQERRRAAMESPLGESLFTVESIREQRRTAKAEEIKTRQTGQPSDLGLSAVQDITEVFQAPPAALQSASLIAPPQSGRGQLLAAGSVIPASLINDIRSDLPGLIRGQVTNDVYDTLTGAHVVIPRGTMLLGSYGDSTAQGQRRLFIYWTRMLFPDGTSVDLQKAGGVDAKGASGLKGRRQSGFVTALLGGALLNLVQNAGRQNTTSSDLATAARAATQASVGTVADRYIESALSQGPSFAVKAGTILNVQIEQDYYLAGLRPE